MKNIKILQTWDSLRSSYWFIPALMVASAIGLSIAILKLDESLKFNVVESFGWTYTHDADGARTILSTIAGSTISVATTAFSIMIVALQLASSQLGPRLLRNFMKDRSNQAVLGTFLATFIYCLLVMRTIQGREDGQFLPQLSVAFSVVLAIINLAVLIYFIHHAAESIQADNVINRVSRDIHDIIEQVFPQKIGQGKKERHSQKDIPADFDRLAESIKAENWGYIQVVDDESLMKIAQENNLLVQMLHRPGHFVVYKRALVKVYPGEKVSKKLSQKINEAFVFGSQRTQQQDIEFAVEQLVEVAVRALSPGINDPFTAIRCIDHLSSVLCHLAQREIPSPYRYDDDDTLRVIADPIAFTEIVDTAFNQIRQYSSSEVAVTIRLLKSLVVIAPQVVESKDRAKLLRHAQMIKRGSQETISEESDRAAIEEQYLTVQKVLNSPLG